MTSGGQEGGSLSRAGGDIFGLHVQSRKSLVVRGWEVLGYVSVGIQSMGPDVALFWPKLSCLRPSRVQSVITLQP